MTEFEALELIAAHNKESYAAILAAARSAGFPEDQQNRLRFDQLREDGYILGDGLTCIWLTPRGLDRLERYKKHEEKAAQRAEQEAQQQAQEKQERKSNKQVAILGILIPAIFAALTAVMDFCGLIPPEILAPLWDRVKDWVK